MNLLRCVLLCMMGCAVGVVHAALPENNSHVPGIHAIGNGELCVYGRQSDILQIFGSPYSSPAMFEMSLEGDYQVSSQRESQTAIWNHTIAQGTTPVAYHTDFLTVTGRSFIRRVRAEQPLNYRIRIKLEDRYAPYDRFITVKQDLRPIKLKGLNQSYRISLAPGIPFYSSYKAPVGYEYQLLTTGSVALQSDSEDNKTLVLSITPGEGALYVIAGPTESELLTHIIAVTTGSLHAQLKKSESSWKKYSGEQNHFTAENLPESQRPSFQQAVDDIGVLIKSQQGRSGSVLAGIVYHMGYVRDQYGVSRALLALGHHTEARDMLDFYYNVWKDNGYIKNAQAIGYPKIFHRHENDESEITGYLVVQAFDYYQKTKDLAFLKRILPMLEWATQAQRRNLIDGMLPFNGDETYIAGGVVPRKVMYHGSAEATLLFIEGSERLLDFVKKNALWNDDQIASLEGEVSVCCSRYRDNFFRDGALYLNNPEREQKVTYPATRPGVCLYPGHVDYFTETFHYKGCLYFCKDCMAKEHDGVEIPPVELFRIPSASLFPLYINAQLFTDQEKRTLLDQVVDQYRKTGRISSQDRILGYDYGMFLYALAECDDPLAGEIYDKMMAQRDGAGAWVEYYVDGEPSGCRCRPWESGINIEAAIEYAD